MPLNLELLGSKLRRYREQFELSIDEVSQATGIPGQSLSAFENAARQPTGDEILILADFFKCDYKFFVSNERLAPFEQTETLFRLHGGQLSKDDRWAIQEFLFLCECEEFLMTQLPGNDRQLFSFVKEGSYFKGHGEKAAVALRQHLGYKSHEVGRNVYQDLRRIGLHVFRRRLHNSNISGVFIKHPIAGKCLLINYSEDIYRQRFTAAHEAGHAILDDEDFSLSFTMWDGHNFSEIRANTFASHFLMPPEFLKAIPDALVWNQEKALDWASKLRVNTEPLAYALKAVGLLSPQNEEEIKSVRIPMSSKIDPELSGDLSSASRARKQELIARGLSGFYVGLCFDAYSGGIISAGRLAEMLLLSEPELAPIAALYGRKLDHGD